MTNEELIEEEHRLWNIFRATNKPFAGYKPPVAYIAAKTEWLALIREVAQRGLMGAVIWDRDPEEVSHEESRF
jgi:hypothetical protein